MQALPAPPKQGISKATLARAKRRPTSPTGAGTSRASRKSKSALVVPTKKKNITVLHPSMVSGAPARGNLVARAGFAGVSPNTNTGGRRDPGGGRSISRSPQPPGQARPPRKSGAPAPGVVTTITEATPAPGGSDKASNLKRTNPTTNIAKNEEPNQVNQVEPKVNIQDMPLFRIHGHGHGHERDNKNPAKLIKESKSARRFGRKQSKMMILVANQLNTERSIVPTEWVVVWGAGLGFRSKKAEVFTYFKPPPQEVRFYAEKPYCTIRFATKEEAELAKYEKTGTEFVPLQPLLIGFLGEEPPVEDIKLSSFMEIWPRGLDLFHEFISDEEQELIIERILPTMIEDGAVLKVGQRLVKHFGYDYRSDTNDININEPLGTEIPECLSEIVERMILQKLIPRKPEQLSVDYFTPGQGITAHVDTHSAFESPIVIISLTAVTIMDFRDGDGLVSIVLPPASLLVMDDESRYQWTHEIADRNYDLIPDQIYNGATCIDRRDRLSLTFRLVRANGECACSFPEMCDTQRAKITADNTARIERDLVHKVYDHVAPHFDHQTRHSPWPKVKDFIETIAPGKCLLDTGCGNGKYFNLTDYIYEVGTDMSTELLNIALGQKTPATAEGVPVRCMRLPFKDNSFHATICIAVLHHLATKERRLEALQEMLRVTDAGGEGLIYVWAKGQRLKEVKALYKSNRELKHSFYEDKKTECMVRLKDYQYPPIPEPGSALTHEENDMLVPWVTKKNGKTEVHHRFFHVFARGELEGLLRELPHPPRILDSYYDQGSWCVRFQKSSDKSIEEDTAVCKE